MNNLIPERRTDKNGVTSTKWVKPAFTAASGKSLPAPQASSNIGAKRLLAKPEHEALTEQLLDRTRHLYQKPNDKQEAILASLRALLKSAPDETVIALRDYLMPDIVDTFRHENRLDFLEGLMSLDLENKASAPKQIAGVNGYLAYFPQLSVSTRTPYGISMIRGLHQIKQLPRTDDYSTVDPHTKEQITALLTTTTILLKSMRMTQDRQVGDVISILPSIRINRDDLIDLIFEYPHKAEDIGNMMVEGNLLDVDIIRERITSSAQSLRDGIL